MANAGKVGQYALKPFPSPAPRGDGLIDPMQVRGNDNQVAKAFTAHDADPTIHLSRTTTTGVTTGAVQILAAVTGACYAVVSGSTGGGKMFVDTVAYANGGTVTALTSTSVLGAADARTYSLSSGALKLAMAAGTYTVQVVPITF